MLLIRSQAIFCDVVRCLGLYAATACFLSILALLSLALLSAVIVFIRVRQRSFNADTIYCSVHALESPAWTPGEYDADGRLTYRY